MPGKKLPANVKAPAPLKYKKQRPELQDEPGGDTFITAAQNLSDPFIRADVWETPRDVVKPEAPPSQEIVPHPFPHGQDVPAPIMHVPQDFNQQYDKSQRKLLKGLGDVYSVHQFTIKNGSVVENSPEFITFKWANITKWGCVSMIVHLLEQFVSKYSIHHAVIDGGWVVILAEDELTSPDEDDLLNCILNRDQADYRVRDP